MNRYYEIEPHIDLFRRGYDSFGQSPLTFLGSEINAKTRAMFEAGIPSNFIQDGDVVTRLNIMDSINLNYGANLVSEEGGNIKFTSVTTPTACTSTLVTTATGNVDNGTHSYKITFINDSGETILSPVSDVVTVDATHKQVALSNIPVSLSKSVTARKIYRTKAGGSLYYFLATISADTTVTYTDNIADASLGNYNPSLQSSFGKIKVDDVTSLELGSSNTLLGQSALVANYYGYGLTAIGVYALGANTTGYYNTAIGLYSLKTNTTGYYNIAVGMFALLDNTSGNFNTAIGTKSLKSNTTGERNTAIGTWSLDANTTGTHNTAIGISSLGMNTTGIRNVAMGDSSSGANTVGTYNVALGSFSLDSNIDGLKNTAVGAYAGRAITGGTGTGTLNTFLGYKAGEGASQLATANNSMALGYGTNVDANNKVIVGNSAVTYIGGQVGWTTISDKRDKRDFKEYEHGLDFVLKLKPVSFKMKDDETDKLHSGFIAQEVEEIGVPFHGLSKPESKNGKYALNYSEFVVPLVNCIKELQNQIDELKDKLKDKK